MRIQVKDFMSTPVTTAVGKDSVKEIRDQMESKGISAIPVVSHPINVQQQTLKIRGIITSTDINKEVDENATIEDIMTASNVHVVHTDSSAQSAAKMMLKHNVHHLIAMEDGKIKGMVSSLDFAKLVAEHDLD